MMEALGFKLVIWCWFGGQSKGSGWQCGAGSFSCRSGLGGRTQGCQMDMVRDLGRGIMGPPSWFCFRVSIGLLLSSLLLRLSPVTLDESPCFFPASVLLCKMGITVSALSQVLCSFFCKRSAQSCFVFVSQQALLNPSVLPSSVRARTGI